jgi:carbamoyl-phosphate synthase small subunit
LGKPALLALADGSLFYGDSIGVDGQRSGEVVFNTSMTGYQEILTDPSYARQMVTLTYPHIGNVGVNEQDEESPRVHAEGLIIRDLPLLSSNWRQQSSLQEYLHKNQVVAIANIDTRRLTRLLRDKGAQNGCLVTGDEIDESAALAAARAFPGLAGMDLAREVTTSEQYEWQEGVWQLEGNKHQCPESGSYKVVAYDYGIKRNILRMLTQRGCAVTVVPAQTPAEDVLALAPDGVFSRSCRQACRFSEFAWDTSCYRLPAARKRSK